MPAFNPEEEFSAADVKRRLKAIFIGSAGNLVEWYDFYAYAAFALYFASVTGLQKSTPFFALVGSQFER